MRHPRVLAIVIPSVLLATMSIALAATIDFNLRVLGHITRPVGCPAGGDLCGETVIDGFGAAEYAIVFTSFVPTSDACGDYTATSTFTLQGDGSVLTLDEQGVACGPDHSFLKGPLFVAYGNPRSFSGNWVVQEGSGQFAGLTGSGSGTGLTAGAAVKVNYAGVLQD